MSIDKLYGLITLHARQTAGCSRFRYLVVYLGWEPEEAITWLRLARQPN